MGIECSGRFWGPALPRINDMLDSLKELCKAWRRYFSPNSICSDLCPYCDISSQIFFTLHFEAPSSPLCSEEHIESGLYDPPPPPAMTIHSSHFYISKFFFTLDFEAPSSPLCTSGFRKGWSPNLGLHSRKVVVSKP
jgi:hypothetical protein